MKNIRGYYDRGKIQVYLGSYRINSLSFIGQFVHPVEGEGKDRNFSPLQIFGLGNLHKIKLAVYHK